MKLSNQEMSFSIVDLQAENEATISQVAALLVEGFASIFFPMCTNISPISRT